MNKESELQSESNDEIGVLDIRHFLLILLDEGLVLFYQPFAATAIEPLLYGALTSAMSAFYSEGANPLGYRIPQDLEIRGYRLSASYGKVVTGILLHHGNVPEKIVIGAQKFVELFESQYRLVLTRWDGDARLFDVADLRKDLFQCFSCTDLLPHEITSRGMFFLQKGSYGTTMTELRRYSARLGHFFIGDAVYRLASSWNWPTQSIYHLLCEMRSKGLITPVQ